jgi:hypothetical protein
MACMRTGIVEPGAVLADVRDRRAAAPASGLVRGIAAPTPYIKEPLV